MKKNWAAAGVLLVWLLGLPSAPATVPPPFFHGNPERKQAALACNVFWGEEFLPDMLNIFDEHNVKITFFIGGSWAKRFPDLTAELARRGHELGNHSYSHPHPNQLNKAQNQEQILRTQQLIQELTGCQTVLYAPPYGEFNTVVLQGAAELGYKTIMWSIDTIDWQKPPPAVIIKRIRQKLSSGAIILIHPTESTTLALPAIIALITAEGYTFVPVSYIL